MLKNDDFFQFFITFSNPIINMEGGRGARSPKNHHFLIIFQKPQEDLEDKFCKKC